MQNNDWKEHDKNSKPLVDTGRKLIPVMKYPKDLDFSKTIGGTTYVVKSHFDKTANESLLKIILRLFEESKNITE